MRSIFIESLDLAPIADPESVGGVCPAKGHLGAATGATDDSMTKRPDWRTPDQKRARSGGLIALAGIFGALLILAAVTVGDAALALGRENAPRATTTGVAFGRFDVSESELAVTHVVLIRLKPTKLYMGAAGERQTETYTNGDFYSANLSPGLYSVIGFFSGNKFFALAGGRHNTFRLEAGSSVYAGTYKLRLTKGGFLKRDKGTFERVDNAGDEAALRAWAAQEMAR